MREGLQPARPAVVARLVTTEAQARRIADILGESFDAAETAVAAFEMPNERDWGVEAYFAAPPDESSVRDLVALAADRASADALTFHDLSQKDWVAASLEGLAPVPAGRFVVHGSHDRHRVSPNRIGIEIDAALAFGTGHHGTTRGCLLALDRLVRTGRPGGRILDIGTGTGVLAIAAAKAGRCGVTASDIDPAAVRVARENARINRVGSLVEVVTAPGSTHPRIRRHGRVGLVFANILLAPLKRLARPIAGVVAPGGRVVLSGLLARQENAALASYLAQGLRLVARIRLDGWVTLVLRRNPVRARRTGRSVTRRRVSSRA